MDININTGNWTSELKKEDILFCKNICKSHGKKYFLSSLFFSKDKRIATWIVYSFFRISDEIVDAKEEQNQDSLKNILSWKTKWLNIYQSERHAEKLKVEDVKISEDKNNILILTKKVFEKYDIPLEYSISFLDSMISDTTKKTYKNYRELESYMYGSSACVGFIMIYIIGFDKDRKIETIKYATMLAEAMQLTNFLRDISEDYFIRDRIYLPQDELSQYNLSENSIKEKIVDKNFKEMLNFQIKRSRELYTESEKGIKFLDKSGQMAVLISNHLYKKILDKIEKENYDVYKKRVTVTFLEKAVILYKIICKKL